MNEIDNLKKRIQELEDLLKKCKKTRPAPIASENTDYMTYIEELREDLESDIRGLKDRQNKTEESQSRIQFMSQNNESRIEDLESQSQEFAVQMRGISKNLKDLQNKEHDFTSIEDSLKEYVDEKVSCKSRY